MRISRALGQQRSMLITNPYRRAVTTRAVQYTGLLYIHNQNKLTYGRTWSIGTWMCATALVTTNEAPNGVGIGSFTTAVSVF